MNRIEIKQHQMRVDAARREYQRTHKAPRTRNEALNDMLYWKAFLAAKGLSK